MIIKLINGKSTYFTLTTYPDGQRSIKLRLDLLNVKEPIKIKCRIKYFEELEVLLCLVAALKKNDFYVKCIEFVYLFGMRSDRAFQLGEPNYFRDVIAPIINSMEIDNIRIFYPHNSTVLKYINNHSHNSLYLSEIENNLPPLNDYITMIAGDKNFGERFNIPYFEKSRKNENIIVKLNTIDNFSSSILILDDLCDGGATFIAEANYLKNLLGNDIKLFLFVAHGLFTNGLNSLAQHFDRIICTNSYQNLHHPKLTQIKVI